MSQYEGQQEYWNPNQGFQQGQADSSYNFEMPVQQEFGQELSFQSFEGGAENAATAATSSFSAEGVNIYGANPYLNPTSHYDAGNMMTPNDQESFVAGDDEFADEPPLLEELGINPDFIMQKRAINAPDDWEGRFWARTWCNSGSQHCETGDCGNKVQCNGAGGVPPASLAEFNLKAWNDGKDYYDISLVDGYNVGVKIEPLGGSGDCNVLHCSNNLNDNCPNELRKYGSGGTIACESSCNKFDKDEYCCRNEFNDPKICNPNTWAVNSAKYFKDNCPDAYSYAYDDHSSLKTCMAGTYRITFG